MADQEEPKGLSPDAFREMDGDAYEPYVPKDALIPEFTIKAIIVGAFLGVLLGAANAYLGLKVGLTVGASIPAAVMAVAMFRILRGGSILEVNTVQTVASAGESLAAGIIFTMPALIMWGYGVQHLIIITVGVAGGLLGVLFMIPLRRYLVVKEHGRLPYPEGTATAQVIVGSQVGGERAKLLFAGLGLGGLYMALMNNRLFGFWKSEPEVDIHQTAQVTADQAAAGEHGQIIYQTAIGGDATPELLGVGYVVGPRIAGYMLAGGAMGWLVLIPLIIFFGQGATEPFYPETQALIKDMGPWGVWNRYIRYVGAGAVLYGGISTLVRSLPTMIGSFSEAIRGMRGTAGVDTKVRTDRDIALKWVVLAAALIAIALWLLPPSLMPVGIVGAIAIVIFAYFFTAVSSRIVGLVGSSNNPVSGMTIATLLLTTLAYVGLGVVGKSDIAAEQAHLFEVARFGVLVVGGVVCVSAAIGGDTSQDLKSGFLLGATPRHQQRAEFVGVIVSALTMSWVLWFLHDAYGIGEGGALQAPQATLMSLVIDGVLGGNLPWGLVFVGVFIGAIIELFGVPVLAVAVGLYLPIHLSTPIVAGGLVRLAAEKLAKNKIEKERRRERGVLFASGLIGGGAIMGVLIGGLLVFGNTNLTAKNALEGLRRQGLHFAIDAPGALVTVDGVTVESNSTFPIRSEWTKEVAKIPVAKKVPLKGAWTPAPSPEPTPTAEPVAPEPEPTEATDGGAEDATPEPTLEPTPEPTPAPTPAMEERKDGGKFEIKVRKEMMPAQVVVSEDWLRERTPEGASEELFKEVLEFNSVPKTDWKVVIEAWDRRAELDIPWSGAATRKIEVRKDPDDDTKLLVDITATPASDLLSVCLFLLLMAALAYAAFIGVRRPRSDDSSGDPAA